LVNQTKKGSLVGRPSNAHIRRDQIIWALYDCLATKGHEKVTIKTIAARACLPPGVIHYYFEKKDDIVFGLARAIVDKYGSLLEERLAGKRSGEDRINAILDFMVDELIFNRPLNRVFYNLIQMAFERAPLNGVMTAMFSAYRRRVAKAFHEAGAGRKGSEALGAALVALSEGFALQWMVEPGALAKKDVRAVLSRFLEG
jgi:AcrR family transcriptional regulator